MCQIQYGITQEHQQLFVLASEQSGQRLLACFDHDSFSYPLPKLGLGGPELFPITADYERRLLFAFLLFVCVNECWIHLNTTLALRV